MVEQGSLQPKVEATWGWVGKKPMLLHESLGELYRIEVLSCICMYIYIYYHIICICFFDHELFKSI